MKKKKPEKLGHQHEVYAIILFAMAVLATLAIASFDPHDIHFVTSDPNHPIKNYAGIIGAYFTWTVSFVVGRSVILIPILLFGWSLSIFFDKKFYYGRRYIKIIAGLLAFILLSTLFAMGAQNMSQRVDAGGVVGAWLTNDIFIPYLGTIGAYLVICTLLILSFSLASDFLFIPFMIFAVKKIITISRISWTRVLSMGKAILSWKDKISGLKFKNPLKKLKSEKPKLNFYVSGRRKKKVMDDESEAEEEMQAEIQKVNEKIIQERGRPINIVSSPKPQKAPPKPENNLEKPPPLIDDLPGASIDVSREIPYVIPRTDILAEPEYLENRDVAREINDKAEILIKTMRQFNIDITVKRVNNGPVLTIYEVQPAPGIKISSILNLSDNLAMALKASSIRILAPIPGKSTVGIEVPNMARNIVYLRELIETDRFQNKKNKLLLALGKDILGNPLYVDLAEMPHLLIAGATNSGKTVCINAIIMSLLYHASPQDVKLLLIDPKMVELAGYDGLPHLISPVITDAKKVPGALNWLIGEMERRYTLFSKAGVRNIESYRQKLSLGDAADANRLNIPYIVTIIDELADLMMVSAQEIETSITRLAQLARAVGIHLILATQRPSVDVVTGLIKANFPARISFKVASKVDSRTILDASGADKLLGKGDFLFLGPGTTNLVRAQCCYVTDKEIENVVCTINDQVIEPEYESDVTKASRLSSNVLDSSQDELYDEAVRIVLDSEQASASLLQRRMRIGYARAARLVDMMEMNSIVSPSRGSKAREVLISREEYVRNDD